MQMLERGTKPVEDVARERGTDQVTWELLVFAIHVQAAVWVAELARKVGFVNNKLRYESRDLFCD